MTERKKVAVVIGANGDVMTMQAAIRTLEGMNIPFEGYILSAHRTPERATEFARTARENGIGVIIAAAGKAAHLAGVMAAHTTLPVIGVPLKASDMGGMDALLATVQMPTGVPVATVAVDGAKNAAILAAQILAVYDTDLAAKLAEMKAEMADDVLKQDEMFRSGQWMLDRRK